MHPAGIHQSVQDWEAMWPRLPRWRGVPCQQFPADLWRYAEVIHELQPPWVLECGTADGGTALFLAEAARCPVISIDNNPRPARAAHPRLTLLHGDTTADDTIGRVLTLTRATRGMILLDDDHSSAHVLRELDLWAPLADYLIIEDTIMEHLPAYGGDGPHVALAKWLPGHPEFAPDPDPVPTQHPGGWLRRVAG